MEKVDSTAAVRVGGVVDKSITVAKVLDDATAPVLVSSVVDKSVFGMSVFGMSVVGIGRGRTEKVDSTGIVQVGSVVD